MDKNSVIGIILVVLAVAGAVASGDSPVGAFINIPSFLVVFGGTFGAVMLAYRPTTFFAALRNIALIFKAPKMSLEDAIDKCIALSTLVRKEGFIAAEKMEVDEPFFKKAVDMLMDGYDRDSMDEALSKEMVLSVKRNNMSIKVMNSFSEIAPAMGMVGTLIGLVAMLVQLDNPDTLGGSMAIALVTTLYGAIIAFGVASPIATKLDQHNQELLSYQSLVRDALLQIIDGKNPKMTFDLLQSYLHEGVRRPTEVVKNIGSSAP